MVLIEFLAPGQATKARPDVESLRQDPRLDELVGRLLKTTEGLLGHSADNLMDAEPDELLENTRMAQVSTYVDSMAMFMSLMHYSSGEKDPSLMEKMKSGELRLATSGDSCGNVTAAFIPGAGDLEEQIAKYFAPGLYAMDKRGEIVLDTPHSADYGGLALITNLGLNDVINLVDYANRNVNAEPKLRWVKSNSPKIHAVAGTKEALNDLSRNVSKPGKFIGPISGYWFHHRDVMDSTYDSFISVLEGTPLQRSQHVYISNRTGGTLSEAGDILSDLAEGIRSPVRIWTEEGDSVVNTSKRLGISDAVVINREITSWLKGSEITPHLMTDFNSMLKVRSEIYDILTRQKSESEQYSRQGLQTQYSTQAASTQTQR